MSRQARKVAGLAGLHAAIPLPVMCTNVPVAKNYLLQGTAARQALVVNMALKMHRHHETWNDDIPRIAPYVKDVTHIRNILRHSKVFSCPTQAAVGWHAATSSQACNIFLVMPAQNWFLVWSSSIQSL